MSDQPKLNTERFDELMGDVLEANATPDQVELFNACLRQDPAARARYIAYIDLHAALAAPAGPLKDPAPDDLPDVMSEIVDQALALRRQHEIEDEANRQLAAQQQEVARNRRFELRRNAESEPIKRTVVIPKIVVGLGLAAVLGLAAWIGWPKAETASTSTPPQTAQQDEPQDPQRAPQPVYVARIDASVDAQWEGLDAAAVQLEQGKLLILRHGMVQVTFDDGATVLVEAPATFQPTGPNGMRLVEGRLSAQVPPSAHGFEVVTPQMVVIDLGTEFGVHVSRRHGTLADVFDGSVIASAPQAGTQIELAGGAAARLSLGQAQIQEVDADSSRFYRDIGTYERTPLISGQGRFLRSTPSDLSYQSFEHSDVSVLLERSNVTWENGWRVDRSFGLDLHAGKNADVYLVHFDVPGVAADKVESVREIREFEMTFERPILGLIFEAALLYETDATLGNPDVIYPSPNDEFAQGREFEVEVDRYTLSADGKTIRFHLRTFQRIDQVRVIVDSTE